MQNRKYFHITNSGEIKQSHTSHAEAHKAERTYNLKDCELIDSEELFYRKVAWLSESGYSEDEVFEDRNGEFVFVEEHNYAHPTDAGGSVDVVKMYISYDKVKPNLKEAVANSLV